MSLKVKEEKKVTIEPGTYDASVVTDLVFNHIKNVVTGPVELVSTFEDLKTSFEKITPNSDNDSKLAILSTLVAKSEQDYPILTPYLDIYRNRELYKDLDDKVIPGLLKFEDITLDEAKKKAMTASCYIGERESHVKIIFNHRLRSLATCAANKLNCDIINILLEIRNIINKELDNYRAEREKAHLSESKRVGEINKYEFNNRYNRDHGDEYEKLQNELGSIGRILSIIQLNYSMETEVNKELIGCNRIANISNLIISNYRHLLSNDLTQENKYEIVDRNVEQINRVSEIITSVYNMYEMIFAAECSDSDLYLDILNNVYVAFSAFKDSLIDIRNNMLMEVHYFYQNILISDETKEEVEDLYNQIDNLEHEKKIGAHDISLSRF